MKKEHSVNGNPYHRHEKVASSHFIVGAISRHSPVKCYPVHLSQSLKLNSPSKNWRPVVLKLLPLQAHIQNASKLPNTPQMFFFRKLCRQLLGRPLEAVKLRSAPAMAAVAILMYWKHGSRRSVLTPRNSFIYCPTAPAASNFSWISSAYSAAVYSLWGQQGYGSKLRIHYDYDIKIFKKKIHR